MLEQIRDDEPDEPLWKGVKEMRRRDARRARDVRAGHRPGALRHRRRRRPPVCSTARHDPDSSRTGAVRTSAVCRKTERQRSGSLRGTATGRDSMRATVVGCRAGGRHIGAAGWGVGGGLPAADRQTGRPGPGRHDLERLQGRSRERNWADPTLVPSVRKLKIAVVAVDFPDQPFVITQPKQQRSVRQPADRRDPAGRVPKFYADFHGMPERAQHGHTVNEYWMEQTHGRIGMSFTPYGPYRMPRPLFEYGLNECRPAGRLPRRAHLQRQHGPRRRHAVARRPGRERSPSQFDLVLRIYAGYDETTIWQEFGEMKFETKEDVPRRVGPSGPARCPNWVAHPLRAVDLLAAGAQQWGLSSIRQGESSGTITHEIVHTLRHRRQQQQPVRDAVPPRRLGPVGHHGPRLVQRSGRSAQALARARRPRAARWRRA